MTNSLEVLRIPSPKVDVATVVLWANLITPLRCPSALIPLWVLCRLPFILVPVVVTLIPARLIVSVPSGVINCLSVTPLPATVSLWCRLFLNPTINVRLVTVVLRPTVGSNGVQGRPLSFVSPSSRLVLVLVSELLTSLGPLPTFRNNECREASAAPRDLSIVCSRFRLPASVPTLRSVLVNVRSSLVNFRRVPGVIDFETLGGVRLVPPLVLPNV